MTNWTDILSLNFWAKRVWKYVTRDVDRANRIQRLQEEVASASKSKQNFHLVSCLARLTRMTWQDSDKYEIVEEGFRQGHGHYFVYVFTLSKVIGTDPWGFPSRKIYIYFSWRPSTDPRFHIISAYPYSASYDYFLRQQKHGYS